VIDHFAEEHRFLSNFWPAAVVLEGIAFATVEHAYVAAKTLDPAAWQTIVRMASAGQVKRFGRTLELRPDWDDVKLGVMEDLVRQKFRRPDLAALLKATGDHELVEGNTWGDTFWGVCRGKGSNHLGKILMQVRRELP
jgi:ribA/ribD-fused uncharacterized protein